MIGLARWSWIPDAEYVGGGYWRAPQGLIADLRPLPAQGIIGGSGGRCLVETDVLGDLEDVLGSSWESTPTNQAKAAWRQFGTVANDAVSVRDLFLDEFTLHADPLGLQTVKPAGIKTGGTVSLPRQARISGSQTAERAAARRKAAYDKMRLVWRADIAAVRGRSPKSAAKMLGACCNKMGLDWENPSHLEMVKLFILPANERDNPAFDPKPPRTTLEDDFGDGSLSGTWNTLGGTPSETGGYLTHVGTTAVQLRYDSDLSTDDHIVTVLSNLFSVTSSGTGYLRAVGRYDSASNNNYYDTRAYRLNSSSNYEIRLEKLVSAVFTLLGSIDTRLTSYTVPGVKLLLDASDIGGCMTDGLFEVFSYDTSLTGHVRGGIHFQGGTGATIRAESWRAEDATGPFGRLRTHLGMTGGMRG